MNNTTTTTTTTTTTNLDRYTVLKATLTAIEDALIGDPLMQATEALWLPMQEVFEQAEKNGWDAPFKGVYAA